MARIVRIFKNNGSIGDLHKGNSGIPKLGRTENNVESIIKSFGKSPRKLFPQLSAGTGITTAYAFRILKNDAHAFPYKIRQQSQLAQHQKTKRLKFAGWFLKKNGKQ